MDIFFLLNLGCAKNLVEGEHIAGILLDGGWQAAPEPEPAQWLIVNTCGFIQPAVDEAVDAILEMLDIKHPHQHLAVVGCLVGRYGKKLLRSLPEVDLFVSPGCVAAIPALLAHPPAGKLAMAPARGIFGAAHPRAVTTGPGWAYLRISDGCGHHCGFCTIPAIRGPLRSRPAADVLAEAELLAANGVKELNLVAQDLASYGRDLAGEPDLAELLPMIADVPGIQWVRPLYLHPDMIDRRLIEVIANTLGVLPYFDIPLQHLADPVLRAMGRKRRGLELRELLAMVRDANPAATLRTTLLVGHPGEGPAEYDLLVKAVNELEFDQLGAFAFCPEAGSRSARLPAPKPDLAAERAEIIMQTQREISRRKLASRVGQTESLLFLGSHRDHEYVRWGRLASQAPEADGETIVTDGEASAGEIVKCRITASHDYDLEAVIL